MELEENGKLPFLGMNVIRNGCRLDTTVYRKPTDTGLLLHYHSHVDARYKRSLLNTMLNRAFKLSSTSFESINSTEAEEHNSFDHSKASTTTCDYRTEREETFRELYLAWVPMPGTNIVTSCTRSLARVISCFAKRCYSKFSRPRWIWNQIVNSAGP